MNIPTVNNQPVSDDNDLAKVLSGAEGQLADPATSAPAADEPTQADSSTAVAQPKAEESVLASHEHEELDVIKKHALEELRPLVDKLDLPPEEKFDILLLIIRSTDDEELVAKAHDTSTQIQDETRKAQALLDIIKEVDYFSNK